MLAAADCCDIGYVVMPTYGFHRTSVCLAGWSLRPFRRCYIPTYLPTSLRLRFDVAGSIRFIQGG